MPNVLFDLARELTASELRVLLAVARCTLGWQKAKDRISLTRFQQLTGMSRQGVLNGIEGLGNRGWLRVTGGSWGHEYEIVLAEEERSVESASFKSLRDVPLVNAVDQTSQRCRPVVNAVDQSGQRGRPKVVHAVDTQKKETKGRKKKGEGEAASPPSSPSSHYGTYFAAILSACGMNSATGMHAKRVSTAAKFLATSVEQKTPGADDVVERFVAWWQANDWRAKKGEIIKPEHFINEWPQFSRRGMTSGKTARVALEDEIAKAEDAARRMLDE